MSAPQSYDLVELLYELLCQYPDGMSEYAILQHLAESDPQSWARSLGENNLGLFRQHFLLFHALYLLRDRLWQQQSAFLEIDALNICLRPYQAGSQALSNSDPLRNYYLDLNNMDSMTVQQLETWLARFWLKFTHPKARAQALAELELEDPVDEQTIKRQYRKLAMQHHPDRGGDNERLQVINQAMNTLLRQGGKI